MIPLKRNYCNQLTPICLPAQCDAVCFGSSISGGFTCESGTLFIALSEQLAQPERAFTVSLLLHGCSLSVTEYRCLCISSHNESLNTEFMILSEPVKLHHLRTCRSFSVDIRNPLFMLLDSILNATH